MFTAVKLKELSDEANKCITKEKDIKEIMIKCYEASQKVKYEIRFKAEHKIIETLEHKLREVGFNVQVVGQNGNYTMDMIINWEEPRSI